MMRTRLALPALCLLTACGGEPDAPAIADGVADAQPLVIAAVDLDEALLEGLAVAFETATGTPVSVTHLDGAAGLQAFIDKDHAAAGDVLLTAGVSGVWRAADEGALRPLAVTVPEAVVPRGFRDPDGAWLGVGFSILGVAYDVRSSAGSFASWDDLAEPALEGRLCVPSLATPGTTALLGKLIVDRDTRPAERLARQWLANTQGSPIEEHAAIRAFVSEGKCAAGIVALAGGRGDSDITTTIRYATPAPLVADVAGGGVARHAANPDQANRFVEWLVREADYPGAIRSVGESGYAELDVTEIAWRSVDAELLAERAGWR